MIRSMTGFGHGEVSNDKNQKVTVEMKSVNHRYCDISLKLPKKLAMFEANIRNIMKEYASRGKIDIYVSYEDLSETAVSLHYNQVMEEEVHRIFNHAIDKLPLQMRMVINLSLDGLKNSEIAEKMNLSEGTVHAYKKEAYKKLRISLKDYYYLLPFLLFISR